MKKKLAWPLLVLFAAVLSASCAQKSVTVGFVGPLTGSSAPIGLGGRNGFLMAFGSGPQAVAGKVPRVELLVKDDHNDADACLRAFEELKAAGCSAVILGTTSQAATKALPWAMANGIFVLSPTISAPIPGADNPLFMRINLTSSAYGTRLADLASDRFGLRRIAVAGDLVNSEYVKQVSDAFIAALAAQGVVPSFTRQFNSKHEKPAAALVADLEKTGSDGLLIVAASTEVALIAKELQKVGYPARILLPPWPLTLDLIENGGTAVEGIVAVSIADLDFQTLAGKDFVKSYQQEYGEHPSFTAQFGYEAALILRTALAAGKGRTARELRDTILDLGEFEGLQGPIRFDAQGNAARGLYTYTIERGRFKSIN